MDEPKEDRMSLLQKFAALFRGETSPIGDKPEPAPVVLPLPEQAGKPYSVEQFIKDTIHIPTRDTNSVDLYDVLPAETRVKLNIGLEGTIVAQYVNRTGKVCYQISVDGEVGRTPLPIYARDGFEVISRPATRMTLVIETPKP